MVGDVLRVYERDVAFRPQSEIMLVEDAEVILPFRSEHAFAAKSVECEVEATETCK